MKHIFMFYLYLKFLHWSTVLHVPPVIVTLRSYTVGLSYSPRWGHSLSEANLEKVWKMEIKCESLELFFPRYNMCFISDFFFVLFKFYSISPVLLLQRIMKKRFVSSSVNRLLYSITSSLEKKLLFWKKVWKKS